MDGAFISHPEFNFSAGNERYLPGTLRYNRANRPEDGDSVPVRLTSLFFPPVQGNESECTPDLPYLEVKSGLKFKPSALCGLPSESVLIQNVGAEMETLVKKGIPNTKGFLIRYQGESTLRTVSSP